MLKKNCEKGYVKAIKKKKRKLPTLKGMSKIKEGECLLSLGKTKEVSQQMSKVDTKKKNLGYKHYFWHP
jgi:hypothetical protein